MYFTKNPSKTIRRDYSITTDSSDRRLTLRLDKASAKCLDLAYATAIHSGLCPFKDRSSYLRWLIHQGYRSIVEDQSITRPQPPVTFGNPRDES